LCQFTAKIEKTTLDASKLYGVESQITSDTNTTKSVAVEEFKEQQQQLFSCVPLSKSCTN
jgi:hypothetical protein